MGEASCDSIEIWGEPDRTNAERHATEPLQSRVMDLLYGSACHQRRDACRVWPAVQVMLTWEGDSVTMLSVEKWTPKESKR